jgi:hypothetical protein
VQNKLNLVVGAGISIDVGIPTWHGLLKRLSERSAQLQTDFEKHHQSGLNSEYLGQIIYHRHRSECDPGPCDMREETIANSWARAIHDAIYKDVPEKTDDIIARHPYLEELHQLARRTSLVITFNFDDILSETSRRSEPSRRAQAQDEDRGPVTDDSSPRVNRLVKVVWEPPLVDRPNTTTIYHVNGILPGMIGKKRSPQLIFTEDSFANAAARSPGVSTEYIFLRFVQSTMLLVGCSLSDSSLKNHLRRNRDRNPANHHYMIHWIKDDDALSPEQIADIFDANLELYNLVTIFLTSSEIHDFLEILNHDSRTFRDTLDDFGDERRHNYHYYIAGPVASGKSTLLEKLRCFNTFEEWTRTPPTEMYLSFDKLDEAQAKRVDEFVYSELKQKNILLHSAGIGFHFMDRAPLDLYAFSKNEEERRQKTAELQAKVIRDGKLQSGEVIFVTADGKTLVKRNVSRGRTPEQSGKPEYFEKQQSALREIYEPTIVIRTGDLPPDEIAKQVARHALFGEYQPIDLNRVMERYK